MNHKCILGIVVISALLVSFSEAEFKPRFYERFFSNDYDETYTSGLSDDGRRAFHRHKELGKKKTDKTNEAVLITTTERPKEVDNSIQTTLKTTALQVNHKTDSDHTLDSLDSLDLVYIGCFDNWFHFPKSGYSLKFNVSYTPATCSQICKEGLSTSYRISSLKGAMCLCLTIDDFALLRVSDIYCNNACPYSTSLPSETSDLTSKTSNNFCGGNLVYSVYCRPKQAGDEDQRECTSAIKHSYPIDIYTTTTNAPDRPLIEDSLPDPGNRVVNSYLGCYKCPEDKGYLCHVSLRPDNHYMPYNTPEACLDFCRRPVTNYQNNGIANVRYPTKYAILKWWDGSSDHYKVPLCYCKNDFSYLEIAPEEECNATCPGDSSQYCGSPPYHESVYCADFENGCSGPVTPCSANSSECGGYPNSTVTTPQATDSESPSPDTPTKEYTTETTTESIAKPTTTTIITLSTSEDPTTEFLKISTDPVAEITTKMPNNNTCDTKCEKVDARGFTWEGCAGQIITKKCPSSSLRNIEWNCGLDGVFRPLQPDFSECRTEWVEQVEKQVEDIKDLDQAESLLERVHESCKKASSNSSKDKYYGHEIGGIVRIVRKAASIAQDHSVNTGQFETVAMTVMDIAGSLFAFTDPWKELDQKSKSNASNQLINSVEETIFALTSKVREGDTYKKLFSLDNSDVSVTGASFHKKTEFNHSQIYPSNISGSYIKLPDGWKTQVGGDQLHIVGMFMSSKIVRGTMPGQFDDMIGSLSENGKHNKLINGNLMSFSIGSDQTSKAPQSIHFAGKGVEITFQHDVEAWGSETKEIKRKLHKGEQAKAVLGSAKCVFWDTINLIWSSDGCKLIASDRYSTTCECQHLTSFAILMDAHKYVGKDRGLEILTLILCPLSIICLVISVVIFSTVRSIQNPRTVITKHLSICLLIGTTLVLLVVDRNYFDMNEEFCVASGIIAHYAFLCAFLWMAIEGWHLYKMVVHVFDSANDYTKIYSILAYVIPIVVVAITVSTGYLSGHRPYGGDVYCWLEGGYIWSFLIPVAVIVAGNLIVLFITLKTAYQLKHTTNVMQVRVKNYRTWLRGCFSITVILGVTWLFGFFTFTDKVGGLIAAYIFTLLNASQGIFLFIFHCLLNEKIRAVVERSIALPAWLMTPADRTQSFMTKTTGTNSNVRSFDAGSKNPDFMYGVSKRPDGTDTRDANVFRRGSMKRNESVATISSGSGSLDLRRTSDSGSGTDGSQNILITNERSS